MKHQGIENVAAVLGAAAAAALALVGTSATAGADTAPPAPPPFFEDFPDFTGTPTTIFDIPGILQDAQGDMDFAPFGYIRDGIANEFTSVLGIQNLGWLYSDPTGYPTGFFAAVDEFQLTLPGTMGLTSDALFEQVVGITNIGGDFMYEIGSPAADFAIEFNLSTAAAGFEFYTPFGDLWLPFYVGF